VLSLNKNCLICGDKFLLKSKNHPFQRFCSNKCIKTNYRQNHPEKDKESKQRYAQRNKEKRVVSTEKYRKANPAYYREYSSLRTRKVKQAKPTWLNEWDEFYISELYDIAIKRGLEVDHIIPITNKKVCGLHVPWNLQLLTISENRRKSNKFDEDIVAIFK
jgi:hypothetical protein